MLGIKELRFCLSANSKKYTDAIDIPEKNMIKNEILCFIFLL